jgi:hypothetical protein
MPKATKPEVMARVTALIPLRLAGVPFHEMCRYASENQWEVGPRQVQRYLRHTDALLASHLEKDGRRLLERHLVLREHLYGQAMAVGDLRTALAALKDAAALRGVYAPKKYTNTDLSGDNPATLLSPQEVEALKAKLAARLSAPPAANGSTPEPAKP